MTPSSTIVSNQQPTKHLTVLSYHSEPTHPCFIMPLILPTQQPTQSLPNPLLHAESLHHPSSQPLPPRSFSSFSSYTLQRFIFFFRVSLSFLFTTIILSFYPLYTTMIPFILKFLVLDVQIQKTLNDYFRFFTYPPYHHLRD